MPKENDAVDIILNIIKIGIIVVIGFLLIKAIITALS